MSLPENFHQMTETEQLRFLEDRERNKPKPGELTMHVRRDDTGREIRTWTGPKSAWMDAYKAPGRLQIRINKDARPSPFYMLSGGRSA